MEKKDTFRNKESWDDVSAFIDAASKKAHRKECNPHKLSRKENALKRTEKKRGKVESGKGN